MDVIPGMKHDSLHFMSDFKNTRSFTSCSYIFKKNTVHLLVNRYIFGLNIHDMPSFFHTLPLDGDKELSDVKTNDFNFVQPNIHPNDIQTFSSYLTGKKILLFLL